MTEPAGLTQCPVCRTWLHEHTDTCPRLDPWDTVFAICDERHRWYLWGAAVLGGLMGMAEAIRERQRWSKLRCSHGLPLCSSCVDCDAASDAFEMAMGSRSEET